MSTRFSPFSPAVLVLGLVGCGYSGIGVTPGGAQDMEYARQLIENGMIPVSGDYTAEGLFSEHDLPIDGEPCEDTLCPRAAAAWIDPVDGSGGQVLLQVGFASDLDPDAFERPDLNLAVAIDVSGSMSGEKLDLSKDALLEVVDQLGPKDTMSLVTYGSRAKVAQGPTPMDAAGRTKMRQAVRDMKARGSTAMEKGIELAYEQIDRAKAGKGVNERVLVLTDAQPNVGATGADSFMGMARRNSEEVGLTVFGVGLDLGAELVNQLATVRGANAYTFADPVEMKAKIRDEFDFMVTPIGYDLDVDVSPVEGREIAGSWGSVQDAGRLRVHIGASTLFPSRRDGGLGIVFVHEGPQPIGFDQGPIPIGTLEVSWTPVDGGERELRTLTPVWSGGTAIADEWSLADDEGVWRMGALVDEVLALDAGSDLCGGDLEQSDAEARILAAAERLDDRANGLRDPDLQIEADLMFQLLENVQMGGECSRTTQPDEPVGR